MVSILPLASLGDILGYRRVYKVGLAAFTVASLICATTDSLATLTAARVIQGLGAAGIMSVNTALVRFIFPAHRLGQGIGLITTVVASTAALGPTVAAAILAVADWPWLFAINVPIGCVALVIGMRVLPRTPGSPHAFDYPSAVLNVLTFGLLIIAIDSLAHGVRYEIAVLELAAAAAFGWLLVRRQLSLPLPLLPVDLLRIPDLQPLRGDLGMLLRRSDDDLRGSAVLSPGRARAQPGGNGAADDALAGDGGADRAHRRASGGPPPCRDTRQHGAAHPGRQPRPDDHPGRITHGPRNRLAHGPVRLRLRPVPIPQ
ncbi:MAG: MFS transporter [Arhodomonas sp.]|nr:MFS transporter [Arhodomonas sp.]